MHELVATGNDTDAALVAAAATGGVLYAAEVADDRQYRFRTLLRAVTDDMAKFADLKRPAPQLITTERVFGHRPAN